MHKSRLNDYMEETKMRNKKLEFGILNSNMVNMTTECHMLWMYAMSSNNGQTWILSLKPGPWMDFIVFLRAMVKSTGINESKKTDGNKNVNSISVTMLLIIRLPVIHSLYLAISSSAPFFSIVFSFVS